LIVAAPAAVQVADPDTHPVHKTAPAVPAGRCILPVPNPAALLAPEDGPVSAPHGPVLGLAPDLAHPGLAPVARAV
jgi:hypothetical protein